MSPNKQLERTVIRRCVRAARAPFHYARASRWTAQRAAAQLRRWVSQENMRSAFLSFLLIAVPHIGVAGEADVSRFTGDWGFVSSDAGEFSFGAGLRGGIAACGAAKQIKIDIREESLPDGSRVMMLRFHPDQPYGMTITSISELRLTTIDVYNQTYDFELREPGQLNVTTNMSSTLFTRCE